jgi:hypothetical protein
MRAPEPAEVRFFGWPKSIPHLGMGRARGVPMGIRNGCSFLLKNSQSLLGLFDTEDGWAEASLRLFVGYSYQ